VEHTTLHYYRAVPMTGQLMASALRTDGLKKEMSLGFSGRFGTGRTLGDF